MSQITKEQLYARYNREYYVYGPRTFSHVLNESRNYNRVMYDIFLSHSSKDQALIGGLKLLLEDYGLSVYVDWEDKNLDPNYVTPSTAKVLRNRMQNCRSLIYAYSDNAKHSRWMPWELGYFDGLKDQRVAVLPISIEENSSIEGSEYVGLYYFIDITHYLDSTKLWVQGKESYAELGHWIDTGKLNLNLNKKHL